MKVDINEIKNFNKMIPQYIKEHLKRNEGGFYVCPKCNKPLTYIDGCDHIECDYCKDIKGYLSLVMYCENKDFITAYKQAKADYELFKISNEAKQVKTYYDLDKRTIGITYFNKRSDTLAIYDTDYQTLPLVFTDGIIGNLLFTQLAEITELKDIPNIIAISHEAYVYNAMSVLMRMAKNHKIKIFLIFENEKEANKIKKALISDLQRYEFTNYIVVEDLINHEYEHTILEHYKHNKDGFKYVLKNIVSQFNARYKKPYISHENIQADKLGEETLKRA